MSITTRLFREGKLDDDVDVDVDRIDELLTEPETTLWVDVVDPDETAMEKLAKEFGFHQLAVEDALHGHQRPKIEQYDTYFFLVAYGVTLQGDDAIPHEMAMFVSHNYFVTVRKPPVFDLSGCVERWRSHPDLTKEGGGFLLYILLDEVVDGYFRIIDSYEERIDVVEDQVFSGEADLQAQNDIFRLKREMLELRRAMAPLREVLDVLQRRQVDVVTAPLEPYYRDVYDHVLRANDLLDTNRDILSSALEANLSVISNRLNEIMKKLTAWAGIILVPTLIAGIYGMNFRHMPELEWYWGYPFALGVMLLSAALLYRSFKRRDWL
jgi:magnesium transporter